MGFDATGGKPYKGNQDGPMWYAVIGLVVVVCFGLVMLGPKMLGSKASNFQNKTIEELISGRPVPEAAGFINEYGFQDELTKSVLVKIHFLDEFGHAELLTKITESAFEGATKSDLSMMIIAWNKKFAKSHKNLILKSDISYFDQALLLLSEISLGLQANGGNSCNIASWYRIIENPDLSSRYMFYDSEYYRFAMRASLLMLGAVEAGSTSPHDYGTLTAEDSEQLAPVVAQMAANPEGMEFLSMLVSPALPSGAVESDTTITGEGVAHPDSLENIDLCEQTNGLVEAFQLLPVETRARFWAAGLEEQIPS